MEGFVRMTDVIILLPDGRIWNVVRADVNQNARKKRRTGMQTLIKIGTNVFTPALGLKLYIEHTLSHQESFLKF